MKIIVFEKFIAVSVFGAPSTIKKLSKDLVHFNNRYMAIVIWK
ncbi:hypothetical protein MADE_1014735 [Alteromonas mediterranea DE]|uniref:Uncharacterized protein n=1 Tax=Alteromonas mediterranea (strain DSM 17117 / CIP 110805 / LMG 28347 / Deep ecotype) TaxID=1774373 RepID=F2GCC5_ALTMD|nr:hypothetical protein MADE_1014735 [Alteromonas mediterranea DE]